MIISDLEIQKLIKNQSIKIEPYFKTFQGPTTYYCHLGNKFIKPSTAWDMPNLASELELK